MSPVCFRGLLVCADRADVLTVLMIGDLEGRRGERAQQLHNVNGAWARDQRV